MDTNQLLDKFVNGEIDETQFETERSKLTPEQQEELNKSAEGKIPDAVEKLKSIRRGIKKIGEKGQADDTSLTAKLKQENLDAAKNQFFSEFGIEKEEDRKYFNENFKTDSINVSNIISDMKKDYVALNPEKYLELAKEKEAREREAEEFNSQNSGAHGGGGGGDDQSKKVSKEVKDFMDLSAKSGRVITAEQAERALRVAKNGGHIR